MKYAILLGFVLIIPTVQAYDMEINVTTEEPVSITSNIWAPITNLWVNGARFPPTTDNGINMQYIENTMISGLYWVMGATEDWRGFSIQGDSKVFGLAMARFFDFMIKPYESRIEELEERTEPAINDHLLLLDMNRRLKELEERCS